MLTASLRALFLAALSISSSLALAQTSLCLANEVPAFTCRVACSSKIASVCRSAQLTHTTGHLQYRFGTSGRTEFVFPPTLELTQFQFAFESHSEISEYDALSF
ncbi:hypothetical protein BH11PSE12_BH11PSE12_09330 [soil metagenome]